MCIIKSSVVVYVERVDLEIIMLDPWKVFIVCDNSAQQAINQAYCQDMCGMRIRSE